MRRKESYISDKMQEVAVDMLMHITFIKDLDELSVVYDEIFKKYKLKTDPFTQLPCMNKEYAELSYSYDKQKALEIYGYNDWF